MFPVYYNIQLLFLSSAEASEHQKHLLNESNVKERWEIYPNVFMSLTLVMIIKHLDDHVTDVF